jgi:hypothetical protein
MVCIPSVDLKSYHLSTIPFPYHLTPNDIYVGPWIDYPLHYEVIPTGWTRWA